MHQRRFPESGSSERRRKWERWQRDASTLGTASRDGTGDEELEEDEGPAAEPHESTETAFCALVASDIVVVVVDLLFEFWTRLGFKMGQRGKKGE